MGNEFEVMQDSIQKPTKRMKYIKPEVEILETEHNIFVLLSDGTYREGSGSSDFTDTREEW